MAWLTTCNVRDTQVGRNAVTGYIAGLISHQGFLINCPFVMADPGTVGVRERERGGGGGGGGERLAANSIL